MRNAARGVGIDIVVDYPSGCETDRRRYLTELFGTRTTSDGLAVWDHV